jgi:uncharacterized protein (TIGR02466 family)
MQINYEILELFPTPIYVTILPDGLSSVIPFFDQQQLSENHDYNNYGFRSKDSYILDKPECKDLANFILANIKEYTKQLGYDYDEYRFGQSWISVKQPNQYHTMHTHPNSLISGVFYYGPVEEKTPAIKFHKAFFGANVSYISPKLVDNKKDIKYTQDSFSIQFEPGLLVLFPSYLLHSVPLNKTDKPRCSLAFNVVPTIGFGDERSLTELIFKKESNETNVRSKKKSKR